MKKLESINAFTLVELLVVIVILSVVATIGFIVYSGATIDAKNTKVTNDIASLSSKINVMRSMGSILSKYYLNGSSTNRANNIKINGNQDPVNYNVGHIDFGALQEPKESFIDSDGNNYIYGYVSDNENQYYQLAGKLVDSNGVMTSKIKGTYNVVNTNTDSPSIIAEKTDDTKFIVNEGDATNMY